MKVSVIEVIKELKSKKAQAQTTIKSIDETINGLQNLCEHDWKVKEVSYGHNGEEVDYICTICAKEKHV